MKLHLFRSNTVCFARFATLFRTGLLTTVCCLLWSRGVPAQQAYRNIVNDHFHTVSNGPQSAIIVDVRDPNNAVEVRRAVDAQVAAVRCARQQGMQKFVALMRQRHLLKPGHSIPVVDLVLLRHNGRLVLPKIQPKRSGRGAPAGNALNFVPTTTGTYAFSAANAATLSSQANTLLYPALKNVLGTPLWNGTVTLNNKDDNTTLVSGIIGDVVIVNGANVSIDMAGFSNGQDYYLGLLQSMAHTFHGALVIGYDAWETGMARAAATAAAQNILLAQGNSGNFPDGTSVDPTGGFNYTPYYDLLNQPALGNNTFLPPTQSSQTLTNFGGMVVPRLEMSSSAWLKCYIENNSFFTAFNSAYYDAFVADPTVALDTTRLANLAAQAVGGTVEAQPFATWFQQQYIFDTSVTTGPKLYVFPIPLPPDAAHPEDGVQLVILYYQTTATGDETELSGTAYPVYLDNTYLTHFNLSAANASVPITQGEGSDSPFFTGIGSGTGSQMRLAIDIPVDNSTTRLFYPANQATALNSQTTYNSIFGVVVGSDTGTLTATFNGGNGTPVKTGVAQGAFGAVGGASIPNNFTKVALSYLPSAGQPITYQRNVYQRAEGVGSYSSGVENIFVLSASSTTTSPVTTLTHQFPSGTQMISLPIQPLNPDLGAVFGTGSTQTLLAQWRQNANGTQDNYLRYPSLPLYQPGYGLWSNFTNVLPTTQGVSITGISSDNQAVVNVSLQYGWNMIGNPFTTGAIDVTNDGTSGSAGGVTFQYAGGDSGLSLAAAISAKYITAGVLGYSPTLGYYDITASTPTTGVTPNLLQPWQGYWILVNVTEGLTLSYVNPNPSTRAAAASRATGVAPTRSRASHNSTTLASLVGRGGWRLPVGVSDSQGHTSYAVLGQSPQGSDRYVSSVDTVAPPPFSSSSSLGVRFKHTDWSPVKGMTQEDYLSDIRHNGDTSTWNMAVSVPQSGQTYNLVWGGTAQLPRNTKLTLIDTVTNQRVLMNTTAGYSFTNSKGAATRDFQVVMEPNGMGRLSIDNLRVDVPLRGRGSASPTSATITYSLTGSAQTSVQIYGTGGRIIRHLATAQSASRGVTQAIWDYRDDHGRTLTTGTYTIEVRAVTTEGQQTRATAVHQIIR